jgi:hypothetical protein
MDTLDHTIYYAVELAQYGSEFALSYLITMSGISQQEFDRMMRDEDLGAFFLALASGIKKSDLPILKEHQNLIVSLDEAQPDLRRLVDSSENYRKYTPNNSAVLAATLIDSDFLMTDFISGSFTGSDVAIIKVEGENFPTTKLGSIDSIRQGSDLSIIGFPGLASNNGLVEETVAKATLTTGKVSSIKNAAGSDKKIIETDATISGGNSGGPGFNNDGEVVGLATYLVAQDGVAYGYLRDIQDLKDLMAKNNITASLSETQTEWEKGIDYFYNSRFSRAMTHFRKVKALYPAHPEVDSFISEAQRRIDNGEDVSDFPILLVAIIGGAVLIGASVAVFLIIRHNKKHKIYHAGIEQGVLTQPQRGMAPQHIIVSQPTITPYNPFSQPSSATPPPTPPQTPPFPIVSNPPSQAPPPFSPINQPIQPATPPFQPLPKPPNAPMQPQPTQPLFISPSTPAPPQPFQPQPSPFSPASPVSPAQTSPPFQPYNPPQSTAQQPPPPFRPFSTPSV